MEYRVKWEIDVEAESPREAAEKALGIQRNAASTAVVFEVNGETIDLAEDEEDDDEPFHFDGDYRNTEQVRRFMPAFLARHAELRAQGTYTYNDLFRGHLGLEPGKNEDTAIYLCQTLKRLDELAEKVEAAIAEGCEPVLKAEGTVRCSLLVHYGWEMGGTGWREYRDCRLVANDRHLAVIPKGRRTHGHLLLGGRLLAKVA